jgi:single-strand DNA-binding protein
MFGKRAEVINKYLHKGDSLFIEGRLKFDSWQDKDGKKRSKLRVLIENFEFLGGSKKQGGGDSYQSPNAEPQGQDAAFGQDDDIPF